jgi:hypothetical protein
MPKNVLIKCFDALQNGEIIMDKFSLDEITKGIVYNK